MAKSAKGKAAVSLPDKRRRRWRAESTAVVKPARDAARRSELATSGDFEFVVYLTYYANSPTHLLTYSHLHRPGHSPTSTSHGHRFDSELNQLAAETGCKGAEDGGNAVGETVQARACSPSGPARNPPTREHSNQPI